MGVRKSKEEKCLIPYVDINSCRGLLPLYITRGPGSRIMATTRISKFYSILDITRHTFGHFSHCEMLVLCNKESHFQFT